MKEKSYTRITLCLDIIKKLQDGKYKGFHELNIIKHQIDLFDEITIFDSETMGISCNNPNVPCNEYNICWMVADFLKKKFHINLNVHIDIQKNIPVQGGLAGGSTNAATVFMMLNKFWNLNISKENLIHYSRNLGMDVPFYFVGKTAFDTESTEILQPIQTSLLLHYILVIPDFGVSTAEAYKNIDYTKIAKSTDKSKKMIDALKENNYDSIVENMHNDFELSVFQSYPEMRNIKQAMINAGCENVIMSGSGSTLIGIAKEKTQAVEISNQLPFKSLVVSSLI